MNSACFCVFLVVYTRTFFARVIGVYENLGFCGFRIYTNRAPHHPNISEVDREGRAGRAGEGWGWGQSVGLCAWVEAGPSRVGGRSLAAVGRAQRACVGTVPD